MTTYLIACSGSKQNPTLNQNSIIFNYQGLSFNNVLGKYRKFIMWLYENNYINHINSISSYNCSNYNHVNKTNLHSFEAWWVYSGFYSKLYKRVCVLNFQQPNNLYEILILSPLWGWIKHTDYIPSYGLDMNDTINFQKLNQLQNENINKDLEDLKDKINKQLNIQNNILTIWQLWSCIFNNILNPINNNQYFSINNNYVDLLFKNTNYRAALQTINCNKANNKPLSLIHGDNLGCKRGEKRGLWLNCQLNNLHQQNNNRLPCFP